MEVKRQAQKFNYWSYYSGSDNDEDGFGDTPYDIPGSGNQDRYPFMNLIQPPNKPNKPSGTNYGKVGETYKYSTSTIDLNNDKCRYEKYCNCRIFNYQELFEIFLKRTQGFRFENNLNKIVSNFV